MLSRNLPFATTAYYPSQTPPTLPRSVPTLTVYADGLVNLNSEATALLLAIGEAVDLHPPYPELGLFRGPNFLYTTPTHPAPAHPALGSLYPTRRSASYPKLLLRKFWYTIFATNY
jgi:hypothetical protein